MVFKPEKGVQGPVEQHDNAVVEGSGSNQLEVDVNCKPSSHVNPIFLAVGAEAGK
jgi:translation initiation factor 2D